jgi:hypothetical protein
LNDGPTYDIHIASDRMTERLENDLVRLGFMREAFLRGTQGIARAHHFSIRTPNRATLTDAWRKARERLAQAADQNEFFGYAEAEVTPPGFVCRFPGGRFSPVASLPFGRLQHEQCSENEAKECDLHFSAVLETLDPRLEDVLEEVGFYHVDVRKSPNRVVRVYTFQTLGVMAVAGLYRSLRDYLMKVSGAEGKLKLEATIDFARYPNCVPVPPIIRVSPLRDIVLPIRHC